MDIHSAEVKKHEANHNCGSICRLMRRVQSLEDLLKKLRWERSAVQPQAKYVDMQQISNDNLMLWSDGGFQMPVNYPRYSKADYESMPEWRLDILFHQYGMAAVTGDVAYKRNYAIAAFLWPDECQ